MEHIAGPLVIAIGIAALVLIGWSESDSLRAKALGVVGFNGVALAVFFLLPRLILGTHNGAVSIAWDRASRGALAVITAGCVLQALQLHWTRSLFARVAGPSLISIAMAPWFLYYAGFGIIHVTWTLVFAGSTAGYIFVGTVYEMLQPVIDAADQDSDYERRKEKLVYIRDELNRFLQLGLTAYTALAASIGVSMTILFRDGIRAWSSFEYQVRALSMTVGFGFISLGLLVWLVRPYLNTYTRVRFYYDSRVVRPDLTLHASAQQGYDADNAFTGARTEANRGAGK